MADIDILCAIDAGELPTLSQDSNNPTGGLNNYVYMIVKSADAISGQAGPELNISANIGDNVRWRATSLDSNFGLSVVFYNFTASQGGNLLSSPTLLGGVNNGTPYTVNEMMPVQGNMPWSTTNVAVPYDFYQSTVEGTGSVTYQWSFKVNKTNNGSLVGYGIWDPFITISN
jgi:hypothetical protein